MMATGTVEVRMYNVGFGDAFRITVRRGDETWRMLVDCGVHSHGAARPLAESVKNIIDDLAEDCGGTPHLDVVVAHTSPPRPHPSDSPHDGWAAVEVDEVWVPFVEDETDADAKGLREAQTRTAQKLAALIDERQQKLAANQTEAMQHAVDGDGDGAATRAATRRRPTGCWAATSTTFAKAEARRTLPSRQEPVARTPSDRASVGWWRTSSGRHGTRRC